MKIANIRAIPMSDPVPKERQHRTDLGTKVKSDAVLILVDTDDGLTGMGASYMPMMNKLFNEPYDIRNGVVHAPQSPGLGFTLRDDVFDRFEYVPGPEFVF